MTSPRVPECQQGKFPINHILQFPPYSFSILLLSWQENASFCTTWNFRVSGLGFVPDVPGVGWGSDEDHHQQGGWAGTNWVLVQLRGESSENKNKLCLLRSRDHALSRRQMPNHWATQASPVWFPDLPHGCTQLNLSSAFPKSSNHEKLHVPWQRQLGYPPKSSWRWSQRQRTQKQRGKELHKLGERAMLANLCQLPF